MLVDPLTTDSDWILTVARIILGVILFAHGAQKLLGWFHGPGLKATIGTMTDHAGVPPLLALGAAGADGRHGLFLNRFGDRKGHDYEYPLLAITLAIVILVRGSGAS